MSNKGLNYISWKAVKPQVLELLPVLDVKQISYVIGIDARLIQQAMRRWGVKRKHYRPFLLDTKVCPYCKEAFQPEKSVLIYCSKGCSNRDRAKPV